MKLYLSQRALLFLFIGGFLLGVLAAFGYSLTELFFLSKPKSSARRVWRYIAISLRDFILFSALGVCDAILFFVYHSGRVRVTVFVLNALGFGIAYYLLFKPILSLLKARIGKRLSKKG